MASLEDAWPFISGIFHSIESALQDVEGNPENNERGESKMNIAELSLIISFSSKI